MENEILQSQSVVLAPMLYMKNLAGAIDFYKEAFDAIENFRITNDDGTVHVAEMSIAGSVFRMHEAISRTKEFAPEALGATTVAIGLIAVDADDFAARAVRAGAEELSPMTDYEYGYRQGTIRDPFGHHWLIERARM